MKLIKLHQLFNISNQESYFASELYLNKDIIRFAHQKKEGNFTYTLVTLIADDKPLNILETPDQINDLCNSVQEVKLVGTRLSIP